MESFTSPVQGPILDKTACYPEWTWSWITLLKWDWLLLTLHYPPTHSHIQTSYNVQKKGCAQTSLSTGTNVCFISVVQVLSGARKVLHLPIQCWSRQAFDWFINQAPGKVYSIKYIFYSLLKSQSVLFFYFAHCPRLGRGVNGFIIVTRVSQPAQSQLLLREKEPPDIYSIFYRSSMGNSSQIW